MSYSDEFFSELSETTIDTGIDFMEMGINQFVESGLIQQIPIVKSIHSTAKVGILIS